MNTPLIYLKVNEENAITEEREAYEGSTPKTSLKDYLELWEYLLDKDKLKVCYVFCHCFKTIAS